MQNARLGMKQITRTIVIASLMVLGVFLWLEQNNQTIELQVLSIAEGDQVSAGFDLSGNYIVHIHSPKGIGGVELSVTDGIWPKAVILRFYLRGLENLRIVSEGIALEASIKSYGENLVRQTAIIAGKVQEPASDHPWIMSVEIVDRQSTDVGKLPVVDGYINVGLPQTLFESRGRQFEIHWVNFYR